MRTHTTKVYKGRRLIGTASYPVFETPNELIVALGNADWKPPELVELVNEMMKINAINAVHSQHTKEPTQ